MSKADRHNAQREQRADREGRGVSHSRDDQAPPNDLATEMHEIEMSDEAAELVRQLQAERDEAVEGRLRALADFRNYQRRALESEQRALDSGAARVVRAMLPVVDDFDLMLSQNPDQMNVQQLMGAVRMVREKLSKALESQGVECIAPQRGEPFNPHRHEAVMRQPANDVGPNAIVSTLQPGFAHAGLVLRPAKVAISPSGEEE